MSMLAERKRKQKWLLNPQGCNWNKDSNSFGQKLMERMGWTEGKGLGRNEDGLKNHIKVAFKNDTNGVGFKETDNASVHQEDFNMLLKTLSNSNDKNAVEPQELKSLEKKSESSRARVHYKKFTRGKDLSQYSEKDLANIFGKKKLHPHPPSILEIKEEVDTPEKSFGVQVIPGGSMTDYFKAKFEKRNSFRCNNKIKGENDNLNENATKDTVSDLNPKKKKKDVKETFVSYVSVKVESEEMTKKKKRKHSEESVEFTQKKQKKSVKQEDLGLINPAFEPLSTNITIKKHVLDTITEIDGETDVNELQSIINEKTKKTKQKLEDTENIDVKKSKRKITNEITPELGLINPVFESLNEISENTNGISKKKKKKSKTNQNGFVCETTSESIEVTIEENPYEEKPKKKSKTNQKSIENPSFTSDNISTSSKTITEGKSVKKSKSKRKQNGLENPSFSQKDTSESSDVIKKEKPKKRSKLKNQDGIENPSFTFENVSEITEDNPYEEKPKKKKKKRTEESASFGIDNPTLNINDDLESSQPLENYEVKRKNKKKLKGLDNPALNLDNSGASMVGSEEPDVDNSSQNVTENSVANIPDCDIMINVVNEPVPTKTKTSVSKGKNVHFSNLNQHHLVSEYASLDDISKRNELFDINTRVIQESLRNQKKGKHATSTNSPQFDIRSVDQINFCNDSSALSNKRLKFGQDNRGFDVKAQKVEESVNKLANSIDNYQAEIENGINENKLQQRNQEEIMVGEVDNSDGENEAHKDGVMLRYKYASFSNKTPYWAVTKDQAATLPKKSYKHLIRGDIVIGFKNSNLHKIVGYGSGN